MTPFKSLKVQQFLPSLGRRDAIANHTLQTQDALRAEGVAGEIWAEEFHGEHLGKVQPFVDFESSVNETNGHLLLYQASTGSQRMVDTLIDRTEPLTIYYHNITPPEMFEPYDPVAAMELHRGRDELKLLADRVPVAMAASHYNAAELTDLGIPDVHVIPPFLPPALEVKPDRKTMESILENRRGMNLLFVSRVAPNKGHADLLRVLAALRAGVDSSARMFIVGTFGPPSYMDHLFDLRDRLGLRDAAIFTQSVSQAELAAYYSTCDLYISMSRHEGFGVPLLEAMHFDLPVIALAAGAVPETLGEGVLVISDPDPFVFAELAGTVREDKNLRETILTRQKMRYRALRDFPRREKMLEAIDAVRGAYLL